MDRIAFKMKLNPGCEEEYKKRHDEIWPELESLLKKSGISDYSIFFDKETNILFAAGIIDGNASSIFMSYAIGNSGPENPTINGNNIEIADIIIPEPGIISIVCLLALGFFGRKK